MPTYWKGRNIIHFAASKKHLGIYPGDEAVAAFAEKLAGYDVSKGTIRIPYDQPLPEDLICLSIQLTPFTLTESERSEPPRAVFVKGFGQKSWG